MRSSGRPGYPSARLIAAIVFLAAPALPSFAGDLGTGPGSEVAPSAEFAQPQSAGVLTAGDSGLVLVPESEIPAVSAGDEEGLWGFRVAVPLYIWYPNMRGNATVHFEDRAGSDQAEQIDFHLNHGEIFDLIFSDLNGIYLFFGEVSRERLTARLDLLYMGFDHVSIDDINESIPDRFFDLDQDLGMTLVHPSVAFQLFETQLDIGPLDSFEFGLGAGFRYMYLQFKAKVSKSPRGNLDGLTVLDVTEHYFEALPVGAEFRLGFCDKWSLNGRILLGGWGIGNGKKGTDGLADLFVGYQFHDDFSFEVGMRWLDMDVKGNDFDWTMRNMWGPTMAVIANF